MSPPSPGLRILMTTDAVGGVWAYTAELAKALAGNGHRVHVVTLGPSPRLGQVGGLTAAQGITLEVTDLRLEWGDAEGLDLARAHRRLTEIERQIKPDVVHLNGYREATAPWGAPVLVVAHSCVRSWWRACRGGEPDEPRWHVYKSNVQAGLASADQWVAPTLAFSRTVQGLYAPPVSGRVIWNGITPLSPEEKEPLILAAGRLWDEAKNVALLASIAPQVPWPIEVAGDTQPPANQGEIPATGIGNLHLLGALSRDRLLQRMQRAAIFVAPALYEPFGLAILEAASAGCALVLSDIDSLRELWDEAALFVPAREPAAWRGVLNQVCSDETLRTTLQRAAIRRARRYSVDRMRAAYETLYCSVHRSRGRRRLASAARHPIELEMAP
jgi:glycosyltransferase involved in cell wall biosynthesis